MEKKITMPLTAEKTRELRCGDNVLISGVIYTGRDAAHKRLVELLDAGKELPIDVKDGVIYYVGPAPANGTGHRLGRTDHQLPHGRLRAGFAGSGPEGHDRQGQAIP